MKIKCLKNKAQARNKCCWYEPPNGVFYRRVCKVMGINPDNNPNVRVGK